MTKQSNASSLNTLNLDAKGRSLRPSVFWVTVWLIVVLVAVKATYVELSPFWTWATPSSYFSWLYLQWLAAAAQADVLFGLGAGLIAAFALLAVRRWAALATLLVRAFFVFGALSVTYAVVGRQVFAHYNAPLTFQLLTLAGEPARLRSSLEGYFTPEAVSALIGVPLAFVLLTYWSRRLDASRSPARRTLLRVSLSIVLIAWLGVGRQLISSNWFEAQDRHLPESPHGILLESVVLAVSGARADLRSAGILAEDVRELSAEPESSSQLTPESTREPTPRPRNVILLVLESVGTRYMSLYGSEFDTTPRLVSERSHAVTFDRYYTPVAWTAYALTSLVLAQRPPMAAYNQMTYRTATREADSIAEVLAKNGYRTAFMAAGDPDWTSEGFLESNGFRDVVRGDDLPGAEQVSSWGTEDRFLYRQYARVDRPARSGAVLPDGVDRSDA